MTEYEIYIFVLCLVVFVALTAFFATLITCLVKMNLKLIKGGLADTEIEKQRAKEAKKSAVFFTFEKILSALLLVVALTVFFFSLDVKINEKKPAEKATVKVVKSPSMSKKDEFNKYLVENDLNNQFQMFDIIVVSPLPKASELKLYDIVVYEVDGQMVVHRIVEIKEPSATHTERRFLLRGDANRYSDKFPVLYSQMRSIYAGKKVPYVGSFIIFMNSPAGWLCVFLIVVVCVAYPFIDKKLKKEIELRFAVIRVKSQDDDKQVEIQVEKKQERYAEANYASKNYSNKAITEACADSLITAFIKPRTETLGEKYSKLSKKQKRFYDEIAEYAAAIFGCRQIKNDRYEEYRYKGGRLVRILIKRNSVICEYLMTNDRFKRYVAGNKVKIKTAPIKLKITDKKSLQAAKDSIDIAKKNIDDEKTYKQEQAKLRRRKK